MVLPESLEFLVKVVIMETLVMQDNLDYLVLMERMVPQDSLAELDHLATQVCLACLDLKGKRESVATEDPMEPLDLVDLQEPLVPWVS